MREIKFRGKSLKYGNWLFGSLWIDGEKCYIIHEKESEKAGEISWYDTYVTEVDASSVGQYTGLKDKNGTEIYEGDIVRLTISDDSTRHFIVEWANESRKLMALDGFEHDGNSILISGWCFNWYGHRLYPSIIDGVPDTERMVVIGNIHDKQ